jgi:hypothetical protein
LLGHFVTVGSKNLSPLDSCPATPTLSSFEPEADAAFVDCEQGTRLWVEVQADVRGIAAPDLAIIVHDADREETSARRAQRERRVFAVTQMRRQEGDQLQERQTDPCLIRSALPSALPHTEEEKTRVRRRDTAQERDKKGAQASRYLSLVRNAKIDMSTKNPIVVPTAAPTIIVSPRPPGHEGALATSQGVDAGVERRESRSPLVHEERSTPRMGIVAEALAVVRAGGAGTAMAEAESARR